MRETIYNSNLAKGCGVVEETLTLLSLCDESTTKKSLIEVVRRGNALARCTDKRSVDIVNLVFYPRFMRHNSRTVIWLKNIREKGVMLPLFKQLLMLYCARENAVMYDYILNTLNRVRVKGEDKLESSSFTWFVNGIVESGQATWSESIQKKVASYIKSVLVDFDFIDKRGNILPYEASCFTILYLMHELHFAGLSDMAIWNHEDWQLFGLDKYQLQDRIMEQNIRGGYIAQSTGDLMTISWNYNTMEEFINGTL